MMYVFGNVIKCPARLCVIECVYVCVCVCMCVCVLMRRWGQDYWPPREIYIHHNLLKNIL